VTLADGTVMVLALFGLAVLLGAIVGLCVRVWRRR
jgi:hypothetical protein